MDRKTPDIETRARLQEELSREAASARKTNAAAKRNLETWIKAEAKKILKRSKLRRGK